MAEINDEERIQRMIADGDIIEADGNLWDLPLPTFKVQGISAIQQLIKDRGDI